MSILLYSVMLPQEEREFLNEITHKGKHTARTISSALIFFAVDRGIDAATNYRANDIDSSEKPQCP